MSKQRGKGDRKKHRHKDSRQRHDNTAQHSMQFDEERFLTDMKSALDRMAFYCNLFYFTHWLPYHQDGTVDDELTSTVKN